ncbi:glutamine amidotransferase [Methyloligella sp. 2.7D]|uniref:glutamine amidotransferase n=1 Tax=unclassified Methyloligella TaxID=2625955 RepID=UPI00157DB140|nr:glutamine amidotransferase [Methyloligella sp. GL2]QKP76940.1 cytoplasmic protein [Methyloligella sp. GL2]
MADSTSPRARVLVVGESWIKQTTHIKGFDHFVTVEYEEGAGVFLKSLTDANFEVTYIRAHEVSQRFPTTLEGLQLYDAIVLSDIGSNSFLLADETFLRSEVSINRLSLLADYVRGGGGLVKIGGYMSFTGIDGRARFGATPLADVLPVEMLPYDDRVELPEGLKPTVLEAGHAAIGETPSDWPILLGYNRTLPKKGATVIAQIGADPLVVVDEVGRGRVLTFASDVAPHWAPPEFMAWPHYAELWTSMVGWAAKSELVGAA